MPCWYFASYAFLAVVAVFVLREIRGYRNGSRAFWVIQNAFDKQAIIDDITSISGKDLEITKENERIVISFAYDKQIVLLKSVSLLIHYSGATKG